MTNETTRRFPRTTEQAFRPRHDSGFSGPYRRPRQQLGAMVVRAAVLAFLALCAAVGAQLARGGA